MMMTAAAGAHASVMRERCMAYERYTRNTTMIMRRMPREKMRARAFY